MADSQAGCNAVNPPIIMKVDAPADSDSNQDNDSNEKKEEMFGIKTTQICSPHSLPPKSILASPKFGSNPFASSTSSSGSTKSLLRPSQLSTSFGSQPKPSLLKPSNLNPLSKEEESNGNNCDQEQEKPSNNSNHTNGDVLKFVPLLDAEKPTEILIKPVASTVPQSQTTPSFVFGQNLQERVIGDKNDEAKPSTSCLDSNGTTDMLFSSALKETVKPEESANKETKSLSESAREYEESRAVKRKYEEVEVKTGEEEETNIIQISCKLFAYDGGNWQERGRGTLRLNDFEITEDGTTFIQSRLVFRTSGSLRVVLNTKIWAEMMVEQASAKSIRLTAIDNSGDIKVYLIMANPEESKNLFKHLHDRVKKENDRQKSKNADASEESQPSKKLAVDTGGH